MFGRNVRVGAIFGIPLEINPSWLITLTFFVFILGAQVYPDVLQDQPSWFYWSLASVSGVFFFSSIIVHELAHSLVARRYGIPVKGITLFMLGGVSQIGRDAKRPLVEFLMAIVGPLTSVALAGVFLALVFTPGLRENRTNVMWQWLFLMNLSLAIVNMAPGFPLDGGRVLRAALWGITGSFRKATRWASLTGRGLGMALIAAGFVTLLGVIPGVDRFTGIWLALVGLFIESSARHSWTQVGVFDILRGFDASSIMQTVLAKTSPESTLLETIHRYYDSHAGLSVFVVEDDERVVGMVTDAQAQRVPKERWAAMTARTTMQPVGAIETIAPGTDLATAMDQMTASQQEQLPVVDDGRLIGCVGRLQILALLAGRGAAAV